MHDPAALADALAKGADVDTSLHYGDHVVRKGERGYKHALRSLLTETSYLWSGNRKAHHQDTREKVIQMTQLILTYSPDLFSQDQYGGPLLDKLVAGPMMVCYQDPDFLRLIGTTVIEALVSCIEHGKDIHSYDLPALFKGIGGPNPETDKSTIRQERAQQLKLVHDHVRQRLLNPTSPQEEFLTRYADKLGYWREPLVLPDLDTLPRPSQAFCDAVKNFGAVMHDVAKTTPRSAAAAAMLIEARFESEQLDKLITSGGHFKPGTPSR